MIGAVIPGQSSQDDFSAAELADLAETILDEGVAVIFTDGDASRVVEAITREAGARTVELTVERLPADGSHVTYLRELASATR